MRQRFVIALTAEARRSGRKIDLERAILEAFEGGVRVVQRSIGGKVVTVEVPEGLEFELQARLPFAVVEPEAALSLLNASFN